MKFNIYIPALVLSLLTSTACSTISSISENRKSDQTEHQINNRQRNDTGKTERKSRGKRKRNTSPMANSRATASGDIVTRPFTQADSIALAKQLAGEWIFDTVAGISVTGDDQRPSLTFDENTGRFYASDGCNYFNGDFSLSSFSSISFGNVISTLSLCDNIPWADYIAAIWNVASRFYMTSRGAEEYLDLRDSADRSLATLKRHQLSDLNGLWDAMEINGKPIDSDRPSIVIDLIEHSVHGNTGCNLFNGTIYQNPDTDRSVQFLNMAVTRMACPNTAVETAFLVALEQTEQAEIKSPDQAVLTDKSGRVLIRLQRTTL